MAMRASCPGIPFFIASPEIGEPISHPPFRSQVSARAKLWRSGNSRSGQHYATKNSCVMAGGRDQHEAMPNSLLEGQSSPKVKTDPDGIEHAPNSDQNRRPN